MEQKRELSRDEWLKLYAKEEERRTQNKIEQIKRSGGDYRKIHEELKQKRLAWWEANKDRFKLTNSLPKQAFMMVLFDYMGIGLRDIQIVYEDERKITWRSFNFCPILEACKRLRLDTRIICKEVNEESVQDFISCLSPKLRFSRSYEKIRPCAEYCEETFELVD